MVLYLGVHTSFVGCIWHGEESHSSQCHGGTIWARKIFESHKSSSAPLERSYIEGKLSAPANQLNLRQQRDQLKKNAVRRGTQP
jgi:hypothetical protein